MVFITSAKNKSNNVKNDEYSDWNTLRRAEYTRKRVDERPELHSLSVNNLTKVS